MPASKRYNHFVENEYSFCVKAVLTFENAVRRFGKSSTRFLNNGNHYKKT